MGEIQFLDLATVVAHLNAPTCHIANQHSNNDTRDWTNALTAVSGHRSRFVCRSPPSRESHPAALMGKRIAASGPVG